MLVMVIICQGTWTGYKMIRGAAGTRDPVNFFSMEFNLCRLCKQYLTAMWDGPAPEQQNAKLVPSWTHFICCTRQRLEGVWAFFLTILDILWSSTWKSIPTWYFLDQALLRLTKAMKTGFYCQYLNHPLNISGSDGFNSFLCFPAAEYTAVISLMEVWKWASQAGVPHPWFAPWHEGLCRKVQQ